MDAIIADLEQQLQSGLEVDPAQKEEVQEVITPPERQQLTKVHTVTNTSGTFLCCVIPFLWNYVIGLGVFLTLWALWGDLPVSVRMHRC